MQLTSAVQDEHAPALALGSRRVPPEFNDPRHVVEPVPAIGARAIRMRPALSQARPAPRLVPSMSAYPTPPDSTADADTASGKSTRLNEFAVVRTPSHAHTLSFTLQYTLEYTQVYFYWYTQRSDELP